ncbi:SDR family NAD(P)-dependent oxidoreductase [Halioxenophilus sp. WMMB6]|uniref:SDR family NAD(P)-dependent oxidoreductase n=1 Tax=Halioxenophilus sp. WMMB6 TaxID=3073815 RepID=UPI00295E4877|nr:SDR family NAD(P)-dependent oxidoreductase [Halioxenophilus sp. WMMB6]
MTNQILSGKTAIITGAASGIGAAHARLFSQQGANILLCDIQQELGRALADELKGNGGKAEFFNLDVSSGEQWQAAVDTAVSLFGGVTTLVNSAGIVSPAGAEKETMEGWQKVVATNQTGIWLGMKTVLPELVKSGNSAIVNIASMLGVIASPGAFAYQATKGAIRQMTKSVALEYGSRGVRANTVCPGVIETPMSAGGSEQIRQMQINATTLKRFGQPIDVANCSLFLCSDMAAYVTAIDMLVDGGTSAA